MYHTEFGAPGDGGSPLGARNFDRLTYLFTIYYRCFRTKWIRPRRRRRGHSISEPWGGGLLDHHEPGGPMRSACRIFNAGEVDPGRHLMAVIRFAVPSD